MITPDKIVRSNWWIYNRLRNNLSWSGHIDMMQVTIDEAKTDLSKLIQNNVIHPKL